MRLKEVLRLKTGFGINEVRKMLGEDAVGGMFPFTIETSDGIVERYTFLKEGQKIGADFQNDRCVGVFKLEGFRRVEHLSEAAMDIFKRRKEEPAAPASATTAPPAQTEPRREEKFIPKSSAVAKDILRGSEVFKDAERKIRLFLRGEKGTGGKNIFVLYGMAGVGKSVAAREALTVECGPGISPEQAHKNLIDISFDESDFGVRLKARDAIEEAKNLYKRYLHNYNLSSRGRPEDEQYNKKRALSSVQQILSKKLFGYELTPEDMEGGGRLEKSASDIVGRLKKLGGDEVRVPYNPSNGWMEIPAELNNKELFLELYQGNAKAIFVDEGDYFLVTDNPLMKVAFNKEQYRRVKVGKKGYINVNGRIIPDEIMVSSKMVITTNVPQDKWNGAIRSRAKSYPFYLTLPQLFDRLTDIIPAIHEKDLPYLPKIILYGMRNTLRRFADKGELHTFDYRVFVELCDEFALMLEDAIKAEREENTPSLNFSIYGMQDEKGRRQPPPDDMVKAFQQHEVGKRVWRRASNQFKKTLLNQIQQMNRAADSDSAVQFVSGDTEAPVYDEG